VRAAEAARDEALARAEAARADADAALHAVQAAEAARDETASRREAAEATRTQAVEALRAAEIERDEALEDSRRLAARAEQLEARSTELEARAAELEDGGAEALEQALAAQARAEAALQDLHGQRAALTDRLECAEAARDEAVAHALAAETARAQVADALGGSDVRLADAVAEAQAAEAARVEAVEDLGAAQAAAAQATEALTAAQVARDEALARVAGAECERDGAVARAEAAEHERALAQAGLQQALAEAGAGSAEAVERARIAEDAGAESERRVEIAELRAADAERRLSDAESARDDARAALVRAEATVEDEVTTLRADLDLALAGRDELQAALAIEREARELAERRLADVAAQPAMAPVPPVMTSPYANGRPSLPPLEVAAAQAKAFAYSAPAQPDGPPPGFTPDALSEFDRALAKASSPRAAGRAALQALATATGWTGGALWQPRDEGDFGCAETWSAYMSGLDAWETMAWRAHLEDGLVPAAAGSGEAHWADTEEMLACPRSRSAAWAELGTLATVPVVHPDGRVIAVLELVRKQREPVDTELLATLCAVAVRVAERLAAIESELAAVTSRY
ncbi:MAG: hypothetical protein JWQ20_1365, partial [Conexibacter sp.]|nr:hypothetical protein [Conexibacter sp.]